MRVASANKMWFFRKVKKKLKLLLISFSYYYQAENMQRFTFSAARLWLQSRLKQTLVNNYNFFQGILEQILFSLHISVTKIQSQHFGGLILYMANRKYPISKVVLNISQNVCQATEQKICCYNIHGIMFLNHIPDSKTHTLLLTKSRCSKFMS